MLGLSSATAPSLLEPGSHRARPSTCLSSSCTTSWLWPVTHPTPLPSLGLSETNTSSSASRYSLPLPCPGHTQAPSQKGQTPRSRQHTHTRGAHNHSRATPTHSSSLEFLFPSQRADLPPLQKGVREPRCEGPDTQPTYTRWGVPTPTFTELCPSPTPRLPPLLIESKQTDHAPPARCLAQAAPCPPGPGHKETPSTDTDRAWGTRPPRAGSGQYTPGPCLSRGASVRTAAHTCTMHGTRNEHTCACRHPHACAGAHRSHEQIK